MSCGVNAQNWIQEECFLTAPDLWQGNFLSGSSHAPLQQLPKAPPPQYSLTRPTPTKRPGSVARRRTQRTLQHERWRPIQTGQQRRSRPRGRRRLQGQRRKDLLRPVQCRNLYELLLKMLPPYRLDAISHGPKKSRFPGTSVPDP
jgi:hypothetical protein